MIAPPAFCSVTKSAARAAHAVASFGWAVVRAWAARIFAKTGRWARTADAVAPFGSRLRYFSYALYASAPCAAWSAVSPSLISLGH